jgi:hypothetical protein
MDFIIPSVFYFSVTDEKNVLNVEHVVILKQEKTSYCCGI